MHLRTGILHVSGFWPCSDHGNTCSRHHICSSRGVPSDGMPLEVLPFSEVTQVPHAVVPQVPQAVMAQLPHMVVTQVPHAVQV